MIRSELCSSFTLNFIWTNQIIGELLIICGQKQPHYESNQLLKQLEKAETVSQFKILLYKHINKLAEQDLIY